MILRKSRLNKAKQAYASAKANVVKMAIIITAMEQPSKLVLDRYQSQEDMCNHWKREIERLS